tara:strand:+ start:807 stop:1775 length:969 start_codon:yes stop_codon:yes gene_type:complete
MAVFTKINKTDINKIENSFKLGKVINYHGIKKGIENTNYYLEFKNKKTVLTIFEKRVNKKDLPFFMKLMYGLSKLKIICPNPIKNKKGSYLFKINHKNACLVSFLKGGDKKKLSPSDCKQIGKNIAVLHKATKKLKINRKNSLSIKLLKNILNKIDNRINKLSKNLRSDMKSDLKKLVKDWPKNLPNGVIHSDLFIDNIFFYKKKFYGFIDFYFSCTDYYAYELATCVNALCFDKKNNKFILNKEKSYNLIKGYETKRKLTSREKNKFNTLCEGSALRYLLTRAYDYLNTPKNAIIKKKNPREYLDKLNFHKNINKFNEYLR